MAKWTPAPPELTALFDAQLRRLPGAEPRKMFGYLAGFVNGNMFAGIFQDTLVLRLSDSDRPVFLGLAGAAPFEPMPGRVMREYVVVPKPMLVDMESLETWLGKACAFAASLPPKTAKKVKAIRPRGTRLNGSK